MKIMKMQLISFKDILITVFIIGIPLISNSQVILKADGPGNTYELINSILAPGANVIETPDAVHPSFLNPNGDSRHISEVWDTVLNKYVFEFYIHVTPDNDPTDATIIDRERNEIKTYAGSPDNLKGVSGETIVFKWKFRLEEGFIPSSGFTHVHQVKAVGGDDGSPLFTLTPRKGSPDKMELVYTQYSSAVQLLNVDLSLFSGNWVEATETIKIGANGTYSIIIKSVSDSTTVLSYSNANIMTIRPGNDFIRPKWGIYRKFAPGVIRDESARFADISIFDGTPPSPPAVLIANPMVSNRIRLTWADNSNNEALFQIQRSEDAGLTWSDLDSVDANITNYTDTSLLEGVAYLYKVRAEAGSVFSAYSNIASPLPAAPVNITAKSLSGSQIKISWIDKSNNESLFRIQRSIDAGNTWSELTTLDANIKSYIDSSLSYATSYLYHVRAENIAGNSIYSDTAGATTLPAPMQIKVVAYVPNWIDLNTFSNTIDFAKLTHINIAFENPDASGNLSWNSGNTSLIEKAHANGVKVLVSIGGGSESESATARANYFSLISDANRAGFISKMKSYITSHNFDGIDVDLEGPAINADYGNFVKGLSDSLKPCGKLVTSALSQGYGGTNVPATAFQYFDFVNIMAYDATGPWDANNPGQHSSYALAVSQLEYWKGRGLSKEKAILGLPFYGYGFGTVYRNYDYPYSEIVTNYPGAENKDMVGSTLYYNGIHTIKQKTTLALDQGGGVMIWELASDAPGPKSLLLAIDQVLQGTDSIPAAPDGLSASPVSASQINLNWNDNSNNETTFRVMRSADGIAGWTSIATVGMNVNSYLISNLLSNTRYFYRVRAENFTGSSTYSSISNATTLGVGIATSNQDGSDFSLYPNPVTTRVNIVYKVETESEISLSVYDAYGQKVKVFIGKEQKFPGKYSHSFELDDLSKGVYFARFACGGYSETSKMIIVK